MEGNAVGHLIQDVALGRHKNRALGLKGEKQSG
jgi:hypothetical protein